MTRKTAKTICRGIDDFGRGIVSVEGTTAFVPNLLPGEEAYVTIVFSYGKLKEAILDWFNEEQYCIECGAKLRPYDYCETHTELEYNNKEWFTEWLCPVCDIGGFEDYGYAE